MRRFITKVCLCFVTLVLQSCSEIIVPDSNSNLNVDDFESAWNHMDAKTRHYTQLMIDEISLKN